MSTFLSRVIIVGIGLIGGSLGLALKKRNLSRFVIGVDVRADSQEKAEALGIVDRCAADLEEAFEIFHAIGDSFENDEIDDSEDFSKHSFTQSERYSDLLIVCTPVGAVADEILAAAQLIEADAAFFERPILFTDVGSTKYEIAQTLQGQLPPHVKYVGSHPIAGSEKSGFEHADPELFAGRFTFLTPTSVSREDELTTEISLLEQFWTQLGSSVIQIPPRSHDLILARTSHFPHLLSFLVPHLLKSGDHLAVGAGFRSFSRLASSDPTLWTDVFLSNKTAVSHAIDEMQQQLEHFRQLLEEENRSEIFNLLSRAKQIRDFLK